MFDLGALEMRLSIRFHQFEAEQLISRREASTSCTEDALWQLYGLAHGIIVTPACSRAMARPQAVSAAFSALKADLKGSTGTRWDKPPIAQPETLPKHSNL